MVFDLLDGDFLVGADKPGVLPSLQEPYATVALETDLQYSCLGTAVLLVKTNRYLIIASVQHKIYQLHTALGNL